MKKINKIDMSYISDKKWQKIIDATYTDLYANSTRLKTEEEIQEIIDKNNWPQSYKDLYFKDPIVYDELKRFALDNKIPRPGCEDDGRCYLPYEFYILPRTVADGIYDDIKKKFRLTKSQKDQLAGCVGLGHAPMFNYDV